MKTLHFKNQEFQAEIIIKGEDYIKGVNLEGFQVFLFDGISDFDYFTLPPDEEWDLPIEPEQINATNVKLNPIEGITVDTVHQGIEKIVSTIKKTVKTVNNIVPDEQGNVNIDGTDAKQPLIGKFTTTVKNIPYKHYTPSIPLEDDDYIVVTYNGLTLEEDKDWEPEVIVQEDGIAIKLMIDESDNDDENNVYGTVYRGFGKIV